MYLEFPISRLAIMRERIEDRLLDFLRSEAGEEIDELQITVQDFNVFRLSIGVKKWMLPKVWLSIQIKVVSDELKINPKKKTELVLEVMDKSMLVSWLEKLAGRDMLYNNPNFEFDGRHFRLDLFQVLKAEGAIQILSDLQIIRLVLSENVLNVLFYPHGIAKSAVLEFDEFLSHAAQVLQLDKEFLKENKKKDLVKDLEIAPWEYRSFVIDCEHRYHCMLPYRKSAKSNLSIDKLYKSFASSK